MSRKNKIKFLLISFFVVICDITTMYQQTLALNISHFGVNPLTNGSLDCADNKQGIKNTALCTDNNNPTGIYGSNGIIMKITNLIAWVAGGAAVLLITISGLRYITAGGDPEKAKSARQTAVAALLGVVVIVLARSLINFVVDRL
jgi:hypothetical protein